MLPQGLVTSFKLLTADWNVTEDLENVTSDEYLEIKKEVISQIRKHFQFQMKRLEILSIR